MSVTADRRQTTNGRATANSEREREFTFAKNVRKESGVDKKRSTETSSNEKI